ncbi:MAG TPA: YgiQ family radical SAM protein, partial [Gemmataceae bacterium]|nr:YgiQ family radical SAM protein [Gemmataceae bacterium]
RLTLPLWTDRHAAPPLPMTRAEMKARGWDFVDVVFVTGDAYVDHPSFAMAILGRVLEAAGLRVAILAQPDWRSCEPWRQFGRPRLFFGISAGNMDSLINHYTANKKVRNDDAYSPGGRIGLRPDRATLPYCHRAREAFSGVPIIAGGVEASLRRLAHYDYWSDTVRRSILLDAKPDLLVFGMGETPIVDIAQRLAAGHSVKQLRDLRGVAYALGASESPPLEEVCSWQKTQSNLPRTAEKGFLDLSGFAAEKRLGLPAAFCLLPTFEQVKSDKWAFVEATRVIHINTNPLNAQTLVQYHDKQAVVVNPPALPLSQAEMDATYDLPYTRRPHPSYSEPIPAYEMIKDSVTIMRGCFGGCTFCSITAHQGRIIQSRSQESILKEVRKMADDPEFKGIISDIGGPTANMYEMRCSRPEVEAKCKRLSCVHPSVCKLLGTDHGPLIKLLKQARTEPGIRKVFVASGIRMDLASMSPEYMKELTTHHVGGHLKVAPEHTDKTVLEIMKKPDIDNFGLFAEEFKKASKEAGKPKQFLVPYFIASHPGSDLHAMIDLALYLKRNGYRPDQVQDFIPAPFDIATCMFYTGIDPFTKKEVYIARHLRDRKLQRALMQFFKPENYFEVRKALEQAGRTDLIGGGCDALIPAAPPREAIEARRQSANEAARGDHYHSVANPAKGELAGERGLPKQGYRPGRKTARRQNTKPRRKGGGSGPRP